MPFESPALYTTPGPEHRIYMKDTKVPEPKGDQVLVHVKATGVCGSDVHFWKHGGIGTMKVKADNGLGHESSGVVVDVGPDVTLWKKGDRVAIEPGIPCVSLCIPKETILIPSGQSVVLLLQNWQIQCLPRHCLPLNSTISWTSYEISLAPTSMASQASRQLIFRRRLNARTTIRCSCWY